MAIGYDLRRMTCKLFEHWGDYHAGTIRRAAFVRRMAPIRREVESFLLRGIASNNKSLVGNLPPHSFPGCERLPAAPLHPIGSQLGSVT